MVMFIPAAVGLAVAAAGVVGVAIKKRKDKKKRQRESAHPETAERQSPAGPAQRPRQRQSQTAEQHRRPQTADRRHYSQPQPRKFPAYNKQSLLKALDTAIASAGDELLDKTLAKPPYQGMKQYEHWTAVRNKTASMTRSLHQLQMPNYDDEIIAASYLLSYHPSHIGLAHSVINRMVNMGESGRLAVTDTDRIHIVDFAAGTLAVQFGVAIAVAEALTRGETVREVIIDSVDTSETMLEAGRLAWEQFVQVVNEHENLATVAEACKVIKFDTHGSPANVRVRRTESWLTSLHGVYAENSDELKECLRALYDKHNPIVGVMTCWGRPSEHYDDNIRVAKQIAPFQEKHWHSDEPYFLRQGEEYDTYFLFGTFEPEARRITETIDRYRVLPEGRPLYWRPTDTAVLTYRRNFSNYGN